MAGVLLQLFNQPARFVGATNGRHGGMALPGRPSRMVAVRLSAGLSASVAAVSGAAQPAGQAAGGRRPHS